jgi:hypothetical protein
MLHDEWSQVCGWSNSMEKTPWKRLVMMQRRQDADELGNAK